MDWNRVEGNWREFRGKVKAEWSNLPDDCLDVIAGKRVALSGKLQEAYGISRNEAEQLIKRFERQQHSRFLK
ncbi:CsbD family protein [Vogesella indigofera]|uniref:CsbD family protein n=1 Tax=Vogesella indigofera TaxID=45465 RepID=UPI00234C659B|nr:CsbD family protein [Vogesella indigofera]MDC7704215.1 CsbD family protein [Vogesella indigofera]